MAKQGIPPTSINPEHHNGIKFDIGKIMGLYQAQFTIGVQTFHVCERETIKEAEWYKQQLIEAMCSNKTYKPDKPIACGRVFPPMKYVAFHPDTKELKDPDGNVIGIVGDGWVDVGNGVYFKFKIKE